MIKSKKLKKLLAFGFITLSLGSTPYLTESFANENNQAQQSKGFENVDVKVKKVNKKEVKTWLKENGVDDSTADSLMKKLEKNQAWDSLKNKKAKIKTQGIVEKINKDETKTTYPDGTIELTEITDGAVTTKITYPDGSIELTGIIDGEVTTKPADSDGSIQLLSIDNGTVTKGSGYISYKGSKIYHYTGVVNAHYYADYTYVTGAYDYIDRAYSPSISVFTGTYSEVSCLVDRRSETSTGAALAHLSFKTSFQSGDTSNKMQLQIRYDTRQLVLS